MSAFLDSYEFKEYLKTLQKDFVINLSNNLSNRTVSKHGCIIGLLIDFLCFDCGLKNLDDLTVGMVNSRFRKWHISKIGDAQESEIKVAVKKFFLFLEKDKGYVNKKIMDSFKKK